MKRLTIAIAIGLFVAACGGGVFGSEANEADVPGSSTTIAETGSGTDVETVTTTLSETEESQDQTSTTTTAEAVTSITSTISTTRPEPTTTTTTTAGGDDTPMTDQVPDELMAQVFSHAEEVAGVDRSAMTVTRAEAVTWRDGSLGCPQPGKTYTQALVDGYWVQLEAGGASLDYRLTVSGGMVLCESGGADPLPRGDT